MDDTSETARRGVDGPRRRGARRPAGTAAAYKADERRFGINAEPDGLTGPQQRYFGHVNEIVEILGVTPRELDEQFRIAAAQQVHISCCSATENFLNLSNNTFKQQFYIPNVKEHIEDVKRCIGLQDGDVRLSVRRLEGAPWKRLAEKQNSRRITGFHAVSTMAAIEFLDRYFGIYRLNQDNIGAARGGFGEEHRRQIRGIEYSLTLPELKREQERERARRIAAGAPPGECLIEALSPGPEENVLQSYAAGGSWPIHSLKSIVPAITYGGGIHAHPDDTRGLHPRFTGGGACVMPSVADYFRAAVHNAVLHVAREKGIERLHPDRYSAIKAHLQAMDDLWPQVLMDDSELRRRDEQERKPYEFSAGQDAAKGLAEAGSPLVMPVLNAMSVKIPLHRKMGDVLFADPVMNTLQAYAAADTARLEKLLIDGDTRTALERAAAAVKAVCGAARQADPDSPPDEATVPIPQWQHHDAVLSALGRCKELTACLNVDGLERRIDEFKKPEPYSSAQVISDLPRNPNSELVGEIKAVELNRCAVDPRVDRLSPVLTPSKIPPVDRACYLIGANAHSIISDTCALMIAILSLSSEMVLQRQPCFRISRPIRMSASRGDRRCSKPSFQ